MWAESQIQQRNPTLLLRDQIPWINVGQDAHVSSTLLVTSQEADISRRAPEGTCWFWLVCWSNNSANSYLSLGALNRRVLHNCLVPQCSYPLHRPRHQRSLANCVSMPASYTSGQPSYPRRHSTCWASWQWSPLPLSSRAVGPGHLLHSAFTCQPGANARRLKSRHPSAPKAQLLISSSDNNNIRAAQWADHQWNAEWADNPTRIFIPDTGTHTPWNDPPKNSMGEA